MLRSSVCSKTPQEFAMKKIIDIWTYLDGKKTNIGALLFMLMWVIETIIVGQWEYNPHWMPKLMGTFEILAPTLTGGGGIHKFVKLYQSLKQPKQ